MNYPLRLLGGLAVRLYFAVTTWVCRWCGICGMPGCSVPLCLGRNGHVFPKDIRIRQKWLVAIKRNDPVHQGKLWTPGPSARVCQQHFTSEDYYWTPSGNKMLKRGVVPTLFKFRRPVTIRKMRTQDVPVFESVEDVNSFDKTNTIELDTIDIRNHETVSIHEDDQLSDPDVSGSRISDACTLTQDQSTTEVIIEPGECSFQNEKALWLSPLKVYTVQEQRPGNQLLYFI